MYPMLFQIGSFRIDAYSVIWFAALSGAIVWSIKRLNLYELDENEARKIMSVSFLFMLIGAHSFEYIGHFKEYVSNPALFLNFNRGGLHEFGAVAGAFISAFVMCRFGKKISFLRLCDVAAPSAMMAIAIGCWGCCCAGIVSDFFTAVHFPFDRTWITRHPVQIYYSVVALLIVVILLSVEKKFMFQCKRIYYSVIAPLALILYSLMRLSVAPLRSTSPVMHSLTYGGIVLALPFECSWLLWSLQRIQAENQEIIYEKELL